MKLLFILIACALIDLTLSERRREDNEDCIVFANRQTSNFYEGPFLEYSYKPCNDPEEIIPTDRQCIALNGDKPLLKNQTCEAGEYKHYHWTIQNYDVINDNKGSTIEFALTPCDGHPELYIKPQILYAGIPMCQLFETEPETEGKQTDTWPFPNNLTGTGKQGPDSELFALEKKAKPGKDVPYPGSFFSTQEWGHNGSITSDDGRPQPHRIRIPSISYGGFFVSVYCKTSSVFEVGIAAQKKVEADQERYDRKDENSLEMKIRRFGYEVDDKQMEAKWGDVLNKEATADEFLRAKGYNCDPKDETYIQCASNFYVDHFGLEQLAEDAIRGSHHPEATARSLGATTTNTTGEFCYAFKDPKKCTEHCCRWSKPGDKDIADFLKYGPFQLREDIEASNGICRPATTKESLCVTKKKQRHMSDDNRACWSDEDRDEGGCERAIQATMEVTFYTGELGGNFDDGRDTWPLFQLNHVEMNDCVSQMDKVGHEFCWEADFNRQVTEYGEETVKEAGEWGYKWAHTCGEGSGDKKCTPEYQDRGKCFWNGSPHPTEVNATLDTQWSKNADDCIMWTTCGVMKNGMPVMVEHKKGNEDDLIWREIPAESDFGGKLTSFDVNGSYYLYGHVTDITRESIESTRGNIEYSRHVLTGDKTWLPLPAHTWVRVEVPVFNNVTYFFNVLKKVNQSSPVESYHGVSAVTTFYHKTQLYSDTTIIIIAAVVIVALLFLLIPFIYTKHKIKEHLRQVYEKHKERGQGRAKEDEGEAEKGDNVVQYAEDEDKDTVVGYTLQNMEKEDPSMLKKDSTQPSKGGNVEAE